MEEIIAVMREVTEDRHGSRLRALIVVLWLPALHVCGRIQDARPRHVLARFGDGLNQPDPVLLELRTWLENICGASGPSSRWNPNAGVVPAARADARSRNHSREGAVVSRHASTRNRLCSTAARSSSAEARKLISGPRAHGTGK
ncbi:MAG: hypothetical protein ACRDN8_04305 [Thermoleophilaceae bacterium]